MPPTKPDSGASIQSVAVAFEILDALSRSPEPVGVTELARRLGQTKARVHRHLANLRTLGFVSQDASSERYQVGWKIYRLGMSVAENFGLRRIVHPHLVRLSADTQQTAILGMAANADVIVVDSVQSNNQIVITVRPGAVIPAPSSALGRVLLAFAPDDTRATALAAPISALTERTIVDRQALERHLHDIRRQWYAVAVAERLTGIAALAAPVFDDHHQVVAAVGLIGSQSDITSPPAPHLVAQVQRTAADISRELFSQAWETRTVA